MAMIPPLFVLNTGHSLPCSGPSALALSTAALPRITPGSNPVLRELLEQRLRSGDKRDRSPEHFFATTAQFWLNPQSIYDLRLAQQK